MRILGFEGTAHTCGVGIVEPDPDDPARCRVLANRTAMLRPDEGGIHPREAADHHVEALPGLLQAALADAGLTPDGLDGVAFSQGPGLGPCLRTVATGARALATRHSLPLSGVNHCVAHLEIGRAMTGAEDPVLLYASGANTQVIAEARGRYRVFGETWDIGIGNALDKFARQHDMPFPGGPRIEELAREGKTLVDEGTHELPELPYSVKGMDLAFSGAIKAAKRLVETGTPLPVACHALQEWTFAMLVEVTERAAAHTEKTEVLLGGGVGRNQRLQGMLEAMAEDRGATYHCPPGPLLSDNGAMIAWNGLLNLRAGHPTSVSTSFVDQKQRTDDIDVVWRAPSQVSFGGTGTATAIARGAEAELRPARFRDQDVLVKVRTPKRYRHPVIERHLVAQRVRREARHLTAARKIRAQVPRVWDADPVAGTIALEEIRGRPVKAVLLDPGGSDPSAVFHRLGAMVAHLHEEGLVHGDLTTSNVLVTPNSTPVLLDFGLAERTTEPEARAIDLHVLQEALEATHGAAATEDDPLWGAFLRGYRDTWQGHPEVLAHLEQLRTRGRYMSSHT